MLLLEFRHRRDARAQVALEPLVSVRVRVRARARVRGRARAHHRLHERRRLGEGLDLIDVVLRERVERAHLLRVRVRVKVRVGARVRVRVLGVGLGF